ncbi:hypothetical protein ACC811_37595, partial [Rhizobium ruizarguesonis]
VVFIDDMARNLHSVRDHGTDCLLSHLMPNSPVHRVAPAAADDITRATDWTHGDALIEAYFVSCTVTRAAPAA